MSDNGILFKPLSIGRLTLPSRVYKTATSETLAALERRYWRNICEMLEFASKTGWFIGQSTPRALDRLGLTCAELGLP